MLCRFCGQWNAAEAPRCRFCGNVADSSEDRSAAGAARPPIRVIAVPQGGHEEDDNPLLPLSEILRSIPRGARITSGALLALALLLALARC